MSRIAKLRVDKLSFGSVGCVGTCKFTAADRSHPNKLPFTGTLLILDEPSNKPPHGSDGHRIFVPKKVAQRRLGTLINMALNYSPDLQGHATRHKVGVITGAKIEGNKLQVSGVFWRKDFPEVMEDLHSSALGLSMELADVYVRDRDEDVWHLEDFHFSGATALHKSAAAYYQTALAAAAAALGVQTGGAMPKDLEKEKKEKQKEADPAASAKPTNGEILAQAIAAGVAPAIKAAIESGMSGVVEAIHAQSEQTIALVASLEELKTIQVAAAGLDLAAAGNGKKKKKDEEEEDGEEDGEQDDGEEEMKSAGKREEEELDAARGEEEEEMDAAKKGEEEEDLDAELEDLKGKPAEWEPGQINKDAKNRGRKTTVTAAGKKIEEIAAAGALLRTLYAQNKKLITIVEKERKQRRRLDNKLEAMESQLEAAAEQTGRQTISAELYTLLAKSNVDVNDLKASGQKLSVEAVDEMIRNLGVELDPTTKIHLKNQLLEKGMMEQGEVRRPWM